MIDLWSSPGPFTIAELAAACRCSRGFIAKAIRTGALGVRRLGRSVRVPASAARRFALEVGAEPAAESELTEAHGEAPLRTVVDGENN